MRKIRIIRILEYLITILTRFFTFPSICSLPSLTNKSLFYLKKDPKGNRLNKASSYFDWYMSLHIISEKPWIL
jgi:hypothetical protein